jgi:Spy/CpxP family protein refolding chaperone
MGSTVARHRERQTNGACAPTGRVVTTASRDDPAPSNKERAMNQTKTTSAAVMGALLLAGGLLGGCASSSTPPAAAGATPTADDVAPSGAQPGEDEASASDLKVHHRHHHGGFAMFALLSIGSLGVSPEQQAQVDQIQADLRTQMKPVHEAQAALLATLADGVAAGNIDAAKADAAAARVATAAGQLHAATADALNRLHAVLTPPQRAALGDKVEAHFQVWRQANTETTPAEHAAGHMGHLTKELGLTPDQIEKARAQLGAGAPRQFDPSAAEAHVKAFATAFAGETFDARSLATADRGNVSIATWGAERMAHFYEALNPVLGAEQRAKLAGILRDHANQQGAK